MDGERKVLLIEGTGGHMAELALRLSGIGFEPILVESFDEAIRLLQGRREIVTLALLPTDLPVRALEESVEQLREAGPGSGVTCAIVGPRPGRSELEKLRQAGVTFAFWDPLEDGTLRFMLNRSFAEGRSGGGVRRDPRVPTHLVARLAMSGRTKEAIIYSLSITGAFLETPRAAISGAHVGMEIDLPGGSISSECEVVFSNVPGNLQRPNLPLGMGVRFLDFSPEATHLLQRFIGERAAACTL